MVQLTCPECGRTFIRQTGTLYKLRVDGHIVTYCGYNCYRRVQKLQESQRLEKKCEKNNK